MGYWREWQKMHPNQRVANIEKSAETVIILKKMALKLGQNFNLESINLLPC